MKSLFSVTINMNMRQLQEVITDKINRIKKISLIIAKLGWMYINVQQVRTSPSYWTGETDRERGRERGKDNCITNESFYLTLSLNYWEILSPC